MNRTFDIEVKNLAGSQDKLTLKLVDGHMVPVRVQEDGTTANDIMILNPAAHDLIDVINNSSKGIVSILGAQGHPSATGEGEITIFVGGKTIPVGPIQLTPVPMIDAAIVQCTSEKWDNGRVVLGDIKCLGYINYIDGTDYKTEFYLPVN